MTNKEEVSKAKYTAPALEKGLDVIEFLAAAKSPRSVNEISQGLGRSRGELFRMLQVLQQRGIIDKSDSGDAFVISDRLFSLRLKRSFAEQITTIARPEMEKFCADTGQSCHLALRSKMQIVVIMRVEHPENLNISVPVGHHRQIQDSPSGRCILAFSEQSLLDEVFSDWDADKASKDDLLNELNIIRLKGYSLVRDSYAVGINGISAPIINQVNGKCEFALTTTVFDKTLTSTPDQHDIAEHIQYAAKVISENYYI